jgi:DNA polymerase-3 subunit delta
LGTLPELNQDSIDLGEVGVTPLLEAASTLPMMASYRFVHGRHLDKLAAKDHGALLSYLAAPCPSTVLVLTAAKLDQRSKLAQALKARKVLTVLEPPRGQQLPDWIMGRAKACGYAISHRAASRLAELVGAELGVLVMSLQKLALFVGANQIIDVADVDAVVSRTQEASIFELTGAIGRRDWLTASTRLQRLLAEGEAPLRVLAMVVREIRLLLGAKELPGRAQDVAATLGVRPFVAERLQSDAKRFAAHELLGALRAAEACDAGLKSRGLKPALQLQRLLVQLCVAA